MRVTRKGQVTLPGAVREVPGITLAESEMEFVRNDDGRWYVRERNTGGSPSRFRRAHEIARPRMTSDELLAPTRGECWTGC